jgi:hypothetical protein
MPAFRSHLNPKPGKRERLAVSSAVVKFTTSVTVHSNNTNGLDKQASGAVLQVVGSDSLYWTIDGTDPSASVGFVANPGDFIYLETAQQVRNFKALRVTADTSIEVAFHWGN